MQLHSKSGFIFYNNFDSGIYYSTSGHESSSSTHLPNISLGNKAFIESGISASVGLLPKKGFLKLVSYM